MGNSTSSSNLAGNDAGASAQRARLNSEPGIRPPPTLRPNPTRNSMYGGVTTPNEGSTRFVASAGGVVHNVKPTTYPPLFGEATVPPRAAPRSTKEASGGVVYNAKQTTYLFDGATVPPRVAPRSTKEASGGVAYNNPQRAAPTSTNKATVPPHSAKETLGDVAYNANSQTTVPPSSNKATVPPSATLRPTNQTPEGVTCNGVSQTKAPESSKATVPSSSTIRPAKETSGATAALASVPAVPVTRTAVSSVSSVTKPSVTLIPSTAQPAAVNPRFSVPISEHNSTPAVPVPDAKITDGSKTASVNPRFHVPVSTTEHTSMSIAPDNTTTVKKSAPPSPQPQSNLCVTDSNRPATVSPSPSRSSSSGPGAAASGVNGQTQVSAPVDPLPSIIAAAAPPRPKKSSPPVATPIPLPLVDDPIEPSAASNEKQEHVSSQDECSLPSPSGQAPVDPHPEVSTNENKQAVTESSEESEPKTPPVEVEEAEEGDVAKEKPKLRPLPVLKLSAGIPIELPMFRDTLDVPCEEACKLTLENALELAQTIETEGLGELILKAACDDMDPKSFVHRTCRYCRSSIVNFHAIFGHVLAVKHLRRLYNRGRYITKDDLEFWSSKVERARKLLPPKFQVSERIFFYKDRDGRIQGPVPELQMQEWYRRGYFTSTTQIGVEQDYYFVSLYDLLKENGHSTPFAAAGAGVFDRTKVNATSIARPEYLLPLVHPIALPPMMFLSDDLLLNEMERLRSKFCKLTPSAFDAALMSLIPLPVYCAFCSTAALKSRSAFFAHLVNRQHLERLAENKSGVTQADIDYWAKILELVEPSDAETNEEHYFLLNGGRLRAENGTILYKKNRASKSTNMPARSLSSSTTSLQSTSSSVPQNSTAASKSRPSATNPPKGTATKPNTSSAKESFFFAPLLSNQKLAESQYLSQADALKVAAFVFPIISRKFNVGVTAEAVNKLAADHLGNAPFRLCPICPKERLNPSIAFFSHILRDRHIAKLYDANIRAAYSDFAFWMKALGLYLPPMAHILQEVQNQVVKKKEQGPPTKNTGPSSLNGDKVKKMENPVNSPLSNLPLMKKNPKKTGLPRAEGVKLISELRAKIQKKYKTDSNKDLYNATKHLFGEESTALCPICPTIRTQCGKLFVDHLFTTKHIEKLYESGGSVCVDDVDHWSNVFLNK